MFVLRVILLVYLLVPNSVEGYALSYAVTDNIGECVRTCLDLNSTCLLIFWKEPNLPGGSLNENCGPQAATLNLQQIQSLSNVNDPSVKVYINEEQKQNSSSSPSSDPECATFVFIQTGSSRSFSTPTTLTSSNECSIVLVTDENSTLVMSAQLACNTHCDCSDLLSIHNSLLTGTKPQAVTACLDAEVNGPGLVVTSAPGGYLVLEVARDLMSFATYDVKVSSIAPGASSSAAPDALVKDPYSGLPNRNCYRTPSYVPSCPGRSLINITQQNPSTVGNNHQNITTVADTTTDYPIETTTTTANNNNNNNYSNNNNNNNKPNTSNNNTVDENSNSAEKRIYTDGSSDLAPDAIAGVVVGCLLLLLLVPAFIYLVHRRHRENKVQPGFVNDTEHVLTSPPPYSTNSHASSKNTTTT